MNCHHLHGILCLRDRNHQILRLLINPFYDFIQIYTLSIGIVSRSVHKCVDEYFLIFLNPFGHIGNDCFEHFAKDKPFHIAYPRRISASLIIPNITEFQFIIRQQMHHHNVSQKRFVRRVVNEFYVRNQQFNRYRTAHLQRTA